MKGDTCLWGVYWILVFISIIEIASATSRLTWRAESSDNPLFDHTKMLIAGFFGFVFLLQNLTSRRADLIKWGGVVIFAGGLLLMALLPIFGREVNGAKRDIFHIQPVELCKVGLIIVTVMIITTKNSFFQRFKILRDKTEGKKYILLLTLMVITCFFIFLQNLSSALILAMTCFGIMLMGGVRLKYILQTLAVAIIAGGLFMSSLYGLHAYHMSNNGARIELGPLNRAHTWEHRIFDGDSTPLWEQKINDDNMQVMYAHMAIANSNGMGTFVGNSVMRDHLPEAYSDYIYAIIFEETGIGGAILVMVLYFVLFFRCYYISLKTDDPFKRLIMIGLPLLIIIQALIHMGVSTDAMFVTGQPLPLISRGGMSILSTSACFGILFGLSANIKNEENKKLKE